jgi:hypothetical protein
MAIRDGFGSLLLMALKVAAVAWASPSANAIRRNFSAAAMASMAWA